MEYRPIQLICGVALCGFAAMPLAQTSAPRAPAEKVAQPTESESTTVAAPSGPTSHAAQSSPLAADAPTESPAQQQADPADASGVATTSAAPSQTTVSTSDAAAAVTTDQSPEAPAATDEQSSSESPGAIADPQSTGDSANTNPTEPAGSENAAATAPPTNPQSGGEATNASEKSEAAPKQADDSGAATTLAAQVESPDPAAAGMAQARLDRLTAFLESQVEDAVIPGAVVAIARRDRLAYLQAVGMRDMAASLPMTTDAIFDLSTLTEPVAAVGALLLAERGRWLLSDRVGRYVSEFERSPLQLMDLMRHSAGLPASLPGTTDSQARITRSVRAAAAYTSSGFVQALAQARGWSSANQTAREGMSYDLLGIAIEQASGQTLGAFLLNEVFIPLDMWDTGFNPGGAHTQRLVAASDSARGAAVRNFNEPVSFDCAGACLYSTATDYLRFARMLLNHGTLDGKRVLSRPSVSHMTGNRLGLIESRIRPPDEVVSAGPAGAGFGFGVSVRNDGSTDALIGSAREYSRAASTGPYFWVDPTEKMAAVLLTTVSDPGARVRLQRAVRTLVLQAIDD